MSANAGLASRTLRNSVLVVGSRGLAKVGVFVVVVLLWRHLGAADYGRFSAMVVYATLAGIVADVGLQTIFVRDVSRDRTLFDRYLANLVSVRLLLSLIALALLALALRLLAPDLFPYTLAAFVLLLTTAYSGLLRAVFYIRGRLVYEAAAILAEAAILLGLTLLAIRLHSTWDVFLWVYSAGYAFTALFALAVIRFRWQAPLRPRFEPAFLWRLLRPGIALALGFTLVTIYAQVDIVLLQLLKNYRMVGWYSAANKYIDAIAWIPQSAMGAVFPVLSMLSTGSGERLRQAYVTSYRMLALLGVPLAVGIGLAAAPIVQLPGGFPQSIPALQLLAPSIALLFVNNAFLYTLTAMNRQGDFTRLALFSLLVNLALNFGLIPGFGYLGAAAASTLTELALFLGGWWLLRRHGYRLAPLSSVARVLLSGALTGAAVFFLNRLLPVLAVIPIAAAVYVAAIVALRALSPVEWSVVRSGLLGGARR